MINISKYILAVVCFFILGSCNKTKVDKLLLEDVAILNDSCPISTGKLGELQRAEIEDSCIVLHYLLTEEFKQIAFHNPKMVFDERLQYLDIALSDTANLNHTPLTKLYIDAFKKGYTVKNQYHCLLAGGAEATLTSTLLKPNVFYNKYHNGNLKKLCSESLKIRQSNENALYESMHLPDSLKVYDLIENNMFVIASNVSSKDYIDAWFCQGDLYKNLSESFNDPSMISFTKQCLICDKGISFRYICKAKKDSMCIDFSKEQLKELLNNYDGVMKSFEDIEKSLQHK